MFKRQKSIRLGLAFSALVLISIYTFALSAGGGFQWLVKSTAQNRVEPAGETNAPTKSLVIGACDVATAALPIEIESTGGVIVPTAYSNLQSAVTAINSGVHQGVINVEVCFNSIETAAIFINSGTGAAPAAYTRLDIYPLADGLTISGPTITGRGLIELNGADNVTIDGDNPNTAGINRNLTITNTAASATTLTSVLRIAVVAATASADNNTFRNLILNGNATGRNVAAATSTTSSENNTFVIYAGGAATGATTAPGALSSVTANTALAGTTINAFNVTNNTVNQAARGIVFNGAAATVSTGVTIANNLVGDQGTVSGTPPITTPTTTVYTKGIFISGTTALSVTGNSVKSILSYVPTTMAGIELNTAIGAGAIVVSNNTVNGVINNGASASRGIDINSASTALFTAAGNTVSNIQTVNSSTQTGFRFSTAATAGTFERNRVSGVNSRGTSTFGAYGMSFEGGNNLIIRNNFIWDVQHNMTSGGSFSTTFGVFGLRIAAGTGHQIYHNSVNLFAAYSGTASSSLLSAAFMILGTGQTGMDVRNNIFVNTTTGGTTSIAHVSMYLPTSGTTAMNLTLNNNDYFTGSTAGVHGVAHVGTTYTAVPAGPATWAGLYTLPNFDPTLTTPNTNLRAYTSTLLVANTNNDNASQKVDPVFTSPTDLHITGASPMIDTGATIGSVIDDIDSQVRPNPSTSLYDVGADEFYPSPGILQLSSTTYANIEGATLVATVNRVSGSSGTVGATYTLTDGSGVGGAACGVGVDYVNPGPTLLSFGNTVTSQPINVTLCTDAVTDPAETFTITISLPTGGATLGSPTAATATITDVPPPFNGTYTVNGVGGGGTYASLTNTGGIFDAINLAGATGPVTINITADLTGETGIVTLNPIAGSPTVLIKPSGAPRTISGTAPVAVIRINGADNIRIDGSTAASLFDEVVGGTPALRELTVQNNSTSPTSGVIALHSSADGAQNNIIQNVNIDGNAPTTTLVGVSIGGASPGTAGADNDGNDVINCRIRRSLLGIYSAGANAGNPNIGTRIEQNDISATGADRVLRIGILAFNEDGIQIIENSVGGIVNSESADAIGIGVGTQSVDSVITTAGGVINALVTRNRVNGVSQDATFSAAGIAIAGGTTGPNTISNNMVTGVIADANAGDLVAGIFVTGVTGADTRLYYNSVAMTGDRSALTTPGTAQYPSYGVAITGTDPTVELKNNIFYTTQTANLTDNPNGFSYAIGMVTTTFANLNSNYNLFHSTGANDMGFRSGSLATAAGTNYATVALWSTAVSDDTNSVTIGESNPNFVNPLSDLHLGTIFSPAYDKGIVVSELRDYDNQLRSLVGFAGGIPDVGADEILAPLSATVNIGGRVTTADGITGIPRVKVILSGGTLTEPITVRTNPFGYYVFEDIEVGQTYILTVNSRFSTFPEPTRVITVQEDVKGIDFTANP